MSRLSFVFSVVFTSIASLPAFANSVGSPSVGWVSFNGTEQCTSTDAGLVCDPGYAVVQVYGYQVTYNYVQGDTAQSVSEAFATAFNNPSSPVTATAANGYLAFTSKVRGSSANSQLTAIYSGDISTGTIGMIGGRDGERNFRMAMYFDNDTTYSDVTFTGLPATQPAGHSILGLSATDNNFPSEWASTVQNYDLTRVDAVNVDEPYLNILGAAGFSNTSGDPCNPSDPRYTIINDGFKQLQADANAIKLSSSKIRFWVNFSAPEVSWMRNGSCAFLNAPYIDVVSLDQYLTDFNTTVKSSYAWFLAHPGYSGEQLALVPGAFVYNYAQIPDYVDPVAQSRLLEEYFDYAAGMNQSCTLPPSSVGTTGIFDSCPVWLVAGFLFNDCCGGYLGLADPATAPIQTAWLAELSDPLPIPSALATILSGQTPFTYYFIGSPATGGQVFVVWCTTSGCTWDYPGGDTSRGTDGTVPAAAAGSPLNVLSTANGLIAYYLASNGHVISLNTSLGFSDTWQDITAAGGNFAAIPGSPLVTVLSGQTPVTFFFIGGGQIIDNWCTTSGCTWDDPIGDTSRGPNGTAPAAAAGSPLNVVSTANGLIAYYLTSNGHVIALNTSLGFSDTWQDITAAGGNFAAIPGSPLVTVLSGQTPVTFFFIGGGQIIDNWCTTSGCTWDDPSGDTSRGPNGTAPAAAAGSPLDVVSTANGLIAYYLTSNGHVIALNTSLGFSDTWQDITAAARAPNAATESPLTIVVTANGASVTHFVAPGGFLYSITCTTAGQCSATNETANANSAPVGFF